MEVEVRPKTGKVQKFGETFSVTLGISEVLVNGELAGHTWNEQGTKYERKHIGLFRAISGYPEELCQKIVDACDELTHFGTTPHVVPEPPSMDEDE